MTITNQQHHRPAIEWLSDLQRAKVEGLSGAKPKITIQDLIEKVNDPNAPEQALIPTSPRSVEACFRLGVDPIELQFHPLAYYKYTGDTDEIARIRYEKNEQVRRERIKSLIDLRKKLVDDGWSGEPGRPGASSAKKAAAAANSNQDGRPNSSTMVEKERQRLDVLRKRHEREIAQMIAHEAARKELADKQQRKVDALEARAAEMARQKAEHDKEWMVRQRELELQRLREQRELEREGKRMAEERYRREREAQRAKEEEEKRLKKEAYLRELERRQRTAEHRAETERILSEQAEKVRVRKQAMEAADAERSKRLQQEAHERHLANLEKRKKAEERINSALTANSEILRKKREEFIRRERDAEARRSELERQEKLAMEQRRQQEIQREQERHQKYLTAQEMEEARKKALRERAEAKERELAELAASRKREMDIRRVEREFELKRRLDRVDEISKVHLYQRQALLERIMDDYERTRRMMRDRQLLMRVRKDTNMAASMQRQQLSQAMEQLRYGRSLERLAGGNGAVNMDTLARRPATARV
ncbi:hypothetical protein VOLCADRAFT_87118 [Volvox carteri f. nagariensis]|uniref:Flagellar associated protein n=1 Tax=Volvox carteri f. nagariensis TaxID=3068 RepID=D8TK79_VOLCA|nr:uncharacterized protein VOLCADRAFT_87118 [Volvox carteri f. nagariensis]EFJ52201.1 hypothetical protein VOLCADRAFT_87118 [Volvox carteri f. nagariensis]|eukprot:XP_002946975.1 hypothetical protein VOLCADRAFT_87118 [Volvox carteri f. nagariensis]